jgi:ABC-type nitrate/sulfonate/bicarbonate transport system permease component
MMKALLDRIGLPLLGVAIALGVFELAPRIGILPSSSFPPPSEVLVELADLVGTPEFRSALWNTSWTWAVAMVITTLIAVPLGMFIGSSTAATLFSRLTIDFLRPIPSVALIPLLVLLYGTQPRLAIILAVFGAVWPLLFQAMYAIRDVDPVARDTATAFGLGPFARLRRVVLPSCTPFIATGMRLSASVALILIVTGEYVVGVDGLGKEVFIAQSGGAYAAMYAYIVTAGLFGVAINLAMAATERRLLFWHASQRTRGLVTEAAL